MKYKKAVFGFTLIEILVVVTIIGILAAVIFIAAQSATGKARDVRRKSDLGQIARFLSASDCFMPNAGAGEYDLVDLVAELQAKYPQYSSYIRSPQDPKSGTPTQSNYRYLVRDSSHCVLYANLENENEPITLTGLTEPTAGGGTGVLRASVAGINGTNIYYQTGK